MVLCIENHFVFTRGATNFMTMYVYTVDALMLFINTRVKNEFPLNSPGTGERIKSWRFSTVQEDAEFRIFLTISNIYFVAKTNLKITFIIIIIII